MPLPHVSEREALPTFDESPVRGSNQSGMRAHNERLVLSLIRRRGPMAKADIARVTGLSAQAVSVIMRALEGDGLLFKGEPVRGKVGQPSVPMGLAADGAYFLGLKVGRRSIQLVLTDFLGEVRARAMQVHTHPQPDTTIAFAHDNIEKIMGRLTAKERGNVAGMGIAIPYFLWNWAQALGVAPEEMAGWRNANVRGEIAARYDFPVFLENDASAACVAEVVFGPQDAPRDFLYFYVGYFVGGGIVLNGSHYSGCGNTGALGPMPVPDGNGGVKQLLDVASLSVLEAKLRAANVQTECMWIGTTEWNIDNTILSCWIDQAGAGLAHAIVSACSVIDFGDVLIDGWIPANIRDALIDATERHLRMCDMTGLEQPRVSPGHVGPDARTLGAASLPLSDRYLVDA